MVNPNGGPRLYGYDEPFSRESTPYLVASVRRRLRCGRDRSLLQGPVHGNGTVTLIREVWSVPRGIAYPWAVSSERAASTTPR